MDVSKCRRNSPYQKFMGERVKVMKLLVHTEAMLNIHIRDNKRPLETHIRLTTWEVSN